MKISHVTMASHDPRWQRKRTSITGIWALAIAVPFLTASRASAQSSAAELPPTDDAEPTRAPRRTRFVLYATGAWTTYSGSPTLSADAPAGTTEPYAGVRNPSGASGELAVGVRVPLGRRGDLQTRVGIGVGALAGDTSYSVEYDEGGAHVTEFSAPVRATWPAISPAAELTFRLIPFDRPFSAYLGAGPRAGLVVLSGTQSVDVTREVGFESPVVARRTIGGTTHGVIGGIAEAGLILGSDESWDIGLRTFAAFETDMEALFSFSLAVGWSFL